MDTLCNDNISTTERVTRAFFGLVLMEVILLTSLSPAVIAVLSIVALYMVFTSIMAWCPVNLLGKKLTEQAPRANAYSRTASHA